MRPRKTFDCQRCGLRTKLDRGQEVRGRKLCPTCAEVWREYDRKFGEAAERIGKALALNDDNALVEAMADFCYYWGLDVADKNLEVGMMLVRHATWAREHPEEAKKGARPAAIALLEMGARKYGYELPERLRREAEEATA